MHFHETAQHLTAIHIRYSLVSELIIGTTSQLSVLFHRVLEVCRTALLAAELLVHIVVVMRLNPFKNQSRYEQTPQHQLIFPGPTLKHTNMCIYSFPNDDSQKKTKVCTMYMKMSSIFNIYIYIYAFSRVQTHTYSIYHKYTEKQYSLNALYIAFIQSDIQCIQTILFSVYLWYILYVCVWIHNTLFIYVTTGLKTKTQHKHKTWPTFRNTF